MRRDVMLVAAETIAEAVAQRQGKLTVIKQRSVIARYDCFASGSV
jgi:hypothetical protein